MKKSIYALFASIAVATPIATVLSCGQRTLKQNAKSGDSSVANREDDKYRKELEIKEMDKKIHEAALKQSAPIISSEVQSLNAQDVSKEMLTIPSSNGVRHNIQSVHASGTDLDVEVLVSSDVEGTTTETYHVLLHGFNPLTSDDIAKQAALARIATQRQAAQALVDKIALEKSIKLELTEDAKTLTAVKLRQTDFIEKQITEGGTTVTISATSIMRVAAKPADGTAVIVQLKVSSPIDGVVAKFYEIQIDGLVAQAHYAAEHNFLISAAAHNPMIFSDIKLDPAINSGARGGVARYGSMMMESFVMSMAELMGYRFETTDLSPLPSSSTNQPIAVDGYTTGKLTATKHEEALARAFNAKITGASINGGIGSSYPSPGSHFDLAKSIEPATDANMAGAGNHITINLKTAQYANGDFLGKAMEGSHNQLYILVKAFQVLKIPAGQAQAYKQTSKLLFSIDDSTQIMHLWTASNAEALRARRENLRQAIAAIKDYPNPGPLSMALSEIYPEGKEGSMYMGPDAWDKDGRLDVLGKNLDAWTSKTSDGHFTFNATKFQITKYSTWIDGTNPGHTKAWIHFDDPNASLILNSANAIVPKFRIAEGQRWEELKNALIASLKNLNTQFAHNTNLNIISQYVSPKFVEMLQYVSDNYSLFSDDELIAMFNKLNNGTFDMYALEYAAKGVTAMPDCVYPDMSTAVRLIASSHLTKGELSGFASFTSPLQLAPWFYGWSDETGPATARRTAGYSSPTDATFYWTAPVAK